MIKKNLKVEDYEFVSNTLKRVVKDDVKEKLELEIGDSKQKDFIPQAKIMKWDNEVNFSIRRDNSSRAFKEVDGKFVCEGAEDVVFYELEDGLEIEIILKEKPVSNVFEYTLRHKGLDFFYQPELTQEEKNNGASRPDNVIGSYAVYHKTKKNNNVKGKNYKTGKAFHIYRPKAIDANGIEVWCDLLIEKDVLSVTVPQSYLDKASYPVVIDPTFGYDTKGGSSYNMGHSTSGSLFEIPVDGILNSITSYIRISTFSGIDVQYGIYEDTLGDNKTRMGITETINYSSYDDWLTLAMSSSVTLFTGNYWLVGYLDAYYMYNYIDMFYDDAASNQSGNSTGELTDPWVIGTYRDRKYSIYATYEEAPSSSVLSLWFKEGGVFRKLQG